MCCGWWVQELRVKGLKDCNSLSRWTVTWILRTFRLYLIKAANVAAARPVFEKDEVRGNLPKICRCRRQNARMEFISIQLNCQKLPKSLDSRIQLSRVTPLGCTIMWRDSGVRIQCLPTNASLIDLLNADPGIPKP